ncbi:HipA family kinase [Neobacillus ginsengisoli]|uniref:HipA-like kinase domain-containing protein n=1 Tax=Neobacillus ginsengisoli TaxID=904295 RepID=A0ABT9XXE2_9BACI|nr:HipA family kinase [Neobacillus ginsengisoli]MDQ0200237.1 hypothetical protein [Neobacillus ginsengisoli]
MKEPIAYRKKMEGKSNAHLITFNDGRDYVVKYLQPGFEKSLANEWVSYCLGRYLDLPIPFAQLVEIPREFSSQVPGIEHLTYTQNQFASLYVRDCIDGHQVSADPYIINHQSLAGIILFDYWLCNLDRTRKNILLQEKMPNFFHLQIIDHAEIFGSYNWVQSDLEKLPVDIMKSATHQLMARCIADEKDFTEQLELIQSIPTLLIEEIVSLIPDDWMVSPEEKKVMVKKLLRRRDKILPELIEKFNKKIYRPLHDNHD